jgi:hypothetical protein
MEAPASAAVDAAIPAPTVGKILVKTVSNTGQPATLTVEFVASKPNMSLRFLVSKYGGTPATGFDTISMPLSSWDDLTGRQSALLEPNLPTAERRAAFAAARQRAAALFHTDFAYVPNHEILIDTANAGDELVVNTMLLAAYQFKSLEYEKTIQDRGLGDDSLMNGARIGLNKNRMLLIRDIMFPEDTAQRTVVR